MKLVEEVAEAAHYIYLRGLVSGIGGNVSARDGEEIAITPTMIPLKDVSQSNVVIVDIDGNVLLGGKPSSELQLHLEIYRRRKDVKGIVHTHSPYATGFSLSDAHIMKMEGFKGLGKGPLKEVPYYPPGTQELADSCAEEMVKENVVVLKNHGIVCCGSDLKEALLMAEFIEESAKTQFIAHLLSQGPGGKK